MHYGLHLCFDARSEATIIGIWERLSQRVPSWMHLGGARPHVTLTECDLVDLDALRGRLNDVACDTGAFDLAFTRVDTFASDEGVVFMEPQASVALTDLRARVVQSLDAVPHVAVTPDRPWHPHCTLAIYLPDAYVPVAVDACRHVVPLEVRATALAVAAIGDMVGTGVLQSARALFPMSNSPAFDLSPPVQYLYALPLRDSP